jgi:hypothetical protein
MLGARLESRIHNVRNEHEVKLDEGARTFSETWERMKRLLADTSHECNFTLVPPLLNVLHFAACQLAITAAVHWTVESHERRECARSGVLETFAIIAIYEIKWSQNHHGSTLFVDVKAYLQTVVGFERSERGSASSVTTEPTFEHSSTMPDVEAWHRLTAACGIHGPLIQSAGHFQPGASRFCQIPPELRIAVYEVFLSAQPWNPTMLRTYDAKICVHLRRPTEFSALLLVSKQIYNEAVVLPFAFKPFRLRLISELREVDPWRRVPHDEAIGNTVLRMPTRLELALTLESTSGLTVQLTRLRLVLEARKEAKFETTVSLSLLKLPRARKRAVLRALATLFGGHNACISVHGVSDMIEDGEEQDELAVMFAQLNW